MRRMSWLLAAAGLTAAGLAPGGAAWAHSGQDSLLGVEEKPGALLPLEARFQDEDGRSVSLGELVRRPTLLSFVYYRCPNACDLELSGIADAVRQLGLEPGKDFQLLTVSIDERETATDARDAKRITLASLPQGFPPRAWRFLTGSKESIATLTEVVGFHFRREGDEFDHPMALIAISPAGKVTRYLVGSEFLPLDIHMSILEASKGTIGPTIARVLHFCLHYDPNSGRYAFNTLKVTAVVTLTFAAAFVLFLVLGGRKRRPIRGGNHE
jgi:protein SCO1/2